MKLVMLRNMDIHGRIRIPYEIRKALKVLDETTFAIEASEEEIRLRKCSPYHSIRKQATEFLNVLYSVISCDAIICTSDCVVAAKGIFIPKDTQITEELSAYIQKGEDHIFSSSEVLYAVAARRNPVAAIFPITQDTAIALVIFRKRNKELTPMDLGSAKLVATALGKKLSE